jgi:hypothetical protein
LGRPDYPRPTPGPGLPPSPHRASGGFEAKGPLGTLPPSGPPPSRRRLHRRVCCCRRPPARGWPRAAAGPAGEGWPGPRGERVQVAVRRAGWRIDYGRRAGRAGMWGWASLQRPARATRGPRYQCRRRQGDMIPPVGSPGLAHGRPRGAAAEAATGSPFRPQSPDRVPRRTPVQQGRVPARCGGGAPALSDADESLRRR